MKSGNLKEMIMSEADPLSEIVACLKRQDLSAATAACREALTLHASNPRAWHLSGIVHAQQAQFEQAVECFQQATALDTSNSLYPYNLALAYKELNRREESLAAYREAIARRPDFLEARNNLANALVQERNSEAAILAFRELVEMFPDHADGHYNLANLLQDTGKFEESITLYRRTLELDPEHSAAWENLGRAYTDEGLAEEAQQVWHAWLERAPDNAVARHMVASTSGQSSVERCADDYVRETFNEDFAKNFDSQLARLGYQAPQLVSDAVACFSQLSTGAEVLDAGCGTGLCGPLIRQRARRLIGIDLSGDMLSEARKRNVYDELIEVEITHYLKEHPDSVDLIVCADTFCYFGKLTEVFAAAAASLRNGGCLAFTVENCVEPQPLGYQLKQHGRFCHTEHYVRQELERTGFIISDLQQATLRRERGVAVEGLVVSALLKNSAAS
jgi:predicted TPR repeat methyltransferase